MPIVKTYHVAKSSTSGDKKMKLNFVMSQEKVSETVFNDLLDAKLKELVGPERMDQFDSCKTQVLDALESKKPVTVLDRLICRSWRNFNRNSFGFTIY